METTKVCKQCRKPVPEGAPEGLCPDCLARVAAGTEPVSDNLRIPPEPADLAQQFPQLEIIEFLGMGGMGMVYKARQPKLDRLVALKILPIESGRGASFAERFSREAKALAILNHPGIVAVYDFGQAMDYYYLVMEFVDGMNLRQLLQTEPVSPAQALDLVMQICTALQFAHDAKVVHRDIKPENILINKKGHAKIADFGLAKLLDATPENNLTASQGMMGTINYMSPEQREKPLEVDHRADIYSLGVVFYEMLTGEVPMGHFEPPSRKVQVDVRLDEVVLRALEREPARRYQKASEVRSGVETIASTMNPAAKNPADSRRFNLKLGIVVAAIAVVVGVLTTGGHWRTWINARQFAAEGRSADEAAEDSQREFDVGYKYEQGIGVEQDYSEAVKWFRKAAEAGHSQAQFSLGLQYEYGRGVEQDYSEAVKWYRKAAEAGNAQGQDALAYQYEHGRGIETNYSEAIHWYRKAAEGGFKLSQVRLGNMYEYGRGVEKDLTEAAKWYRKAADSGDDSGRDNLTRLEKREATDPSDPQHQLELGYKYEQGIGVERNFAEAIKWFRKAADAGNSQAAQSLAYQYEQGRGVGKDYAEAARWYRKAAEAGNSLAQDALGYYCECGLGVPTDNTEAVKWYSMAAAAGNSHAQGSLGFHYANGVGVARDIPRGIKWFRKAADAGNYYAMNNLGMMSENGVGMEKDIPQAIEWYVKAAAGGDAGGRDNLARVLGSHLIDNSATNAILKFAKADSTAAAGAAGNRVLETVVFDTIPLTDAIQKLAGQGSINIIFDPAVFSQKTADGTLLCFSKVLAKWRNVTLLQALQALLDNYDLQMTETPGRIMRITSRDANAPATARTKVNWSKNAPTNMPDEVLPVVAFDGVPLPDAIRALALQAGMNIQLDPHLGNQPYPALTLMWKNLTGRQALQALLDNHGWEMTQIPGNPILRVSARNTHEAGPLWTKTNLLATAQTNGAAPEEVLPLLSFDGVPWQDAVWALSRQAGLNIQFDPALLNQQTPSVTERWKNVTARQALQALLENWDCQLTQVPGTPILRVTVKSP